MILYDPWECMWLKSLAFIPQSSSSGGDEQSRWCCYQMTDVFSFYHSTSSCLLLFSLSLSCCHSFLHMWHFLSALLLFNQFRKWNLYAALWRSSALSVVRAGVCSTTHVDPRTHIHTLLPLRREISNFQGFRHFIPSAVITRDRACSPSLAAAACAVLYRGVRHLPGWKIIWRWGDVKQNPLPINSIMQPDRTKSTNLRKHHTILSTSCYEIDFLMLK